MKNLILFVSLFLSLSVNAQTYCNPPFATSGQGCILSVRFGSLYNSTPCVGGFVWLYSGAIPTFYRDSTYTLEMVFDSTITTPTWLCVAIPFDTSFAAHYNFYTPNRFYYADGLNIATTHTRRLSVTIPHDATLGHTRLRIVRNSFGTTHHICNDGIPNAMYGETQNYTINIQDTPPPNISLGINTINRKYSIYPNPTTGVLHINGTTISIYNTLGILVFTSYRKPVIDITDLPTGIYIADIDGNKTVFQKQ